MSQTQEQRQSHERAWIPKSLAISDVVVHNQMGIATAMPPWRNEPCAYSWQPRWASLFAMTQSAMQTKQKMNHLLPA